MGRTHLRSLAGSSKVQIVAVAEPDDASRRAVVDQFEVEGFELLDDLLGTGTIDGLLVATPTDTHADVIDVATAAGVPVLCEKPCGARPEDARRVLALASARSVPVQIAYWRRYVPSLRRLREEIGAGAFGKVLSLTCAQWDGEPPAPAFRSRSGGIFVDMGVHEFDEVRWLLGGEVASVAVAGSAAQSNSALAPDPDAAVGLLEMTGGETVVVALGRHYPGGDMVRVELFGTKGHVHDEFLTPSDGEAVFLDALVRQAEAFAEYVEGGICTGATVEDAVHSLEVAAEAQRQLHGR
jgi:myo-inositol 2-dehydrogenase/D-chiro-inositol 1-dehydrogenase